MARSVMNTQIQEFFTESFTKEERQRLAWYQNYRKDRQGTDSECKSKQFEVFKKKITTNGPTLNISDRLPTEVAPQRYNKKTTKYTDILEPIQSKERGDLTLLTTMRPVSRNTKVLLYDGFTKEGKGRYQYLRRRNETNPEKKYAYPLVSSMDIGWRILENVKNEDSKKPRHGRTRIVADSFYTRTGIPSVSDY